jgi:hypothetical protein
MGSTKLREDSDLPTEGWSDWTRAMVPAKSPSRAEKEDFRRRPGNRRGFVCITDMKDVFDKYDCGIYEWMAVGTKGRHETKVVYIGSTCREKPGALKYRIKEYCSNGSHKSELIDGALEKGYELWVRVKPSGRSKVRAKNLENAEKLENDLLSKYNYAWNIRDNIGLRDVLPE